jgi:alpha-tubulin suppressor-like RCC1 family protein
MGSPKNFCQIVNGIDHTIGIDYAGQVWGWGGNGYGQLGTYDMVNKSTPVTIQGSTKTFCSIDGGNNYTIGLDNRGQVWGWGNNYYGQLGDNSVIAICTPVSIHGVKKTFCSIVLGVSNTIGLDHRGQVWGWGYNLYGQLGNNSIISERTPVSILGASKTFCKITNSNYFSIGIDNRGQVWGWGNNYNAQLGDNSTTNQCTPVSILGAKKTFCNVGVGYKFSFGIDYTGQVWSWGENNKGQLGVNSFVSYCTPVSILGAKKTFCKVIGGEWHALAIDHNGRVWSWGYNNYGQLGNNDTPNKYTPVSILGNKKTFCNITGGFGITTGIDNHNQVWSWGDNSLGQLGDNTVINQCTPVLIAGVPKSFCKIANGLYHTTGIDNYGQVWSWGDNSSGQLGDNTVINQCTPVLIAGAPKSFCKIENGDYHSIAIDKYGQVWGWGGNGYGQLGDNSITYYSTPVAIQGSPKLFCSIHGGVGYSIGIDNSGQVWGWGRNDVGQLGDNTGDNKCTPVSIHGVKRTFCTISAGSSHSSGIDNNGQLWVWGENGNGQFGDGSTTNQCTPVSIHGVKKTFCQISNGYYHTIGLDNYGQVWGWGNNLYGELGNNSNIPQCTPISILGVKKTFCKIGTSIGYHNIGIDNYGQVWAWGTNNKGQIGTFINATTPIKVCNL